jgi:hypothetical protein
MSTVKLLARKEILPVSEKFPIYNIRYVTKDNQFFRLIRTEIINKHLTQQIYDLDLFVVRNLFLPKCQEFTFEIFKIPFQQYTICTNGSFYINHGRNKKYAILVFEQQ